MFATECVVVVLGYIYRTKVSSAPCLERRTSAADVEVSEDAGLFTDVDLNGLKEEPAAAFVPG